MLFIRRYLALWAIVGAGLLLGSCDSGGGGGVEPPPTSDRAALLANVGSNLIVPAYAQLQTATAALLQATEAFAADPNETTLVAAQQALKTARLAWQDANLFQFGPADVVTLRTQVNTFPTDVDKIEANVASGQWVLGSLANRDAGGLPALDYLLHGLGATPAEIIARYTTAPEASQRASYLTANAALVRSDVDATATGWQTSGGNYLAEFLSPARGGVDVGSALGMLVNALVLHYERFLRDGKIGIPAGVRSAGVPRPKATEAFYGGYSLALARANLAAIERLFLGTRLDGTDGPGLDEYLQTLGATTLSNEIKAAIQEAKTALDGLSDPLSAQIETDNDAVLAAFTTMQRLVVLLKADLASVLGITITFQDNDGD